VLERHVSATRTLLNGTLVSPLAGTGRGSFDAAGEVGPDHEMDTERSDEYERPALTWLLREVTPLNSYLMEAGVSGRSSDVPSATTNSSDSVMQARVTSVRR
jgi:hypothetical protein